VQTLRLKPDEAGLAQAADILRRGGLVAFPTETVYGLGANALDRSAVLKIFEAKQRPTWDPIIVHGSSVEELRRLVREWPEHAETLARVYMPGPLTLLLPKADLIPSECTAGRDKVGVRIPSHEVAKALIRAAGLPIAAPSANRFGHTSPTTAEHVLADLDGRIDAVLDGGPTDVGVESTVIDVTIAPPVIYRPGGITREMIETVIGPVTIAQRSLTDVPVESLESPGLGIRHYAPRAKLILFHGTEEFLAIIEREKGKRVGVMLPDAWDAAGVQVAAKFAWGGIEDLEQLAHNLYDGLRTLDEQNVEVIVCPIPRTDGVGLAILDRLTKAAK
jgi:L-threonylcarbamoyladenylate synthase